MEERLKSLQEEIIELYGSEIEMEGHCALDSYGIARKLGTDKDRTRNVVLEMRAKHILHPISGGYSILNPKHLWNNK